MARDKRLYFVRNLETEEKEENEEEYEVTSDSQLLGSYNSSKYRLTSWESPAKKPGVYRKLVLTIKAKTGVTAEEFWAAEPTEKGFYHGGGIPDEIITLASLFLRVRLKLGPCVRSYDTPMILPKCELPLDSDIIKDDVNLGDLNNWFELVVGLR